MTSEIRPDELPCRQEPFVARYTSRRYTEPMIHHQRAVSSISLLRRGETRANEADRRSLAHCSTMRGKFGQRVQARFEVNRHSRRRRRGCLINAVRLRDVLHAFSRIIGSTGNVSMRDERARGASRRSVENNARFYRCFQPK